MKKLILTLALAFTGMLATAQATYTNGSVNTTPGDPTQVGQPYNGTNPTGQPNQVMPSTIDPNPVQPIAPSVPPSYTQPNTTTPTMPNSTAPGTPVTPMTPQNREQL